MTRTPREAFLEYVNGGGVRRGVDTTLAFFVGYSCGAHAISGNVEEIIRAFRKEIAENYAKQFEDDIEDGADIP